jgi:vacuolar-type H+-ATPase subunit I/STV1
MKTALQAIILALTALMGLWALGHGIALGVSAHHRMTENQDVLSAFIEGSVFIAGGICVVSVAVKQLYAWLTHHRDGGLM